MESKNNTDHHDSTDAIIDEIFSDIQILNIQADVQLKVMQGMYKYIAT